MHTHDDSTKDRHGHRGHRPGGLLRLVALGLVVAAVAKEWRLPADERTWHGTVAGFVPYEFRPVTPERLKERLWSPEGDLVGPHVFGVGWSVNVGRLVRLVQERRSA